MSALGKYIGDTALAAVGTAGPILNLLRQWHRAVERNKGWAE